MTELQPGNPNYEMSVDEDHRLVRFVIRGMMSEAEAQAMIAGYAAAGRALIERVGHFNLLVQLPAGVQTREVAGMIEGFSTGPLPHAERIALVASGALVGLQAKRIAGTGRAVSLFSDAVAAEAWLSKP